MKAVPAAAVQEPPSTRYSHVAPTSRPDTVTVALFVILSVAAPVIRGFAVSLIDNAGPAGTVVSRTKPVTPGKLEFPAASVAIADTPIEPSPKAAISAPFSETITAAEPAPTTVLTTEFEPLEKVTVTEEPLSATTATTPVVASRDVAPLDTPLPNERTGALGASLSITVPLLPPPAAAAIPPAAANPPTAQYKTLEDAAAIDPPPAAEATAPPPAAPALDSRAAVEFTTWPAASKKTAPAGSEPKSED